MKTRVLGKTGLSVSELALGGLFVSSVGGALHDQMSTASQDTVSTGRPGGARGRQAACQSIADLRGHVQLPMRHTISRKNRAFGGPRLGSPYT